MAQVIRIKKKLLNKEKSFNANMFINRDKILSNYHNFFKNKEKKPFLEVIEIKKPKIINKGDLVFQNKGTKFKLEIADKDKNNKQEFFIFNIIDLNYTKNFILWFFSQKEIQEYLSLFVKGNIITYLPRSSFRNLDIIWPTKIEQNLRAVNISSKSDSKEVINFYLKEYRRNIENHNYLSASFLVGAISEAIIYQFLIDKGVKKKYLKNKMYGQLLELIKIMNLDLMNYEDFYKIKTFRNLIHPENALKNINKLEELEKEVEPIFNNIIKNFGI